MRRALVLCAIVGGAVAIVAIPSAALAGGGCHGGLTQQDATGQDEVTVRMIDACFQASITTVDPGTPVTFVNEDLGLTHNLGGNGWGNFEDMITGDTYRASFDAPGIYPFACNYHPGMTGAIVVGDGTGAGNGEEVTVMPFEPVADTAKSLPAADPSNGSTLGFLAIGVLGLALGAGITAGVSRVRRHPTAG
jgi:plastocyanin